MQIYNVPYNFNHEEKVFGGYISIRQAIYLILGTSMIGIFFMPIGSIFIKSLLFMLLATIFTMFAFLKIDETNADKYFIYILSFFLRKKKFILEKGKENGSYNNLFVS